MNIRQLFERLFNGIFEKIRKIFKVEPTVVYVRTEKELDELPVNSASILDPNLTEREVFKYSLDPRTWQLFDDNYVRFTTVVKNKKILGMMNEMFKRKNAWIDDRSSSNYIATKKAANAFYDELDRIYSDHLSKELGARMRASVLYGHKPEFFATTKVQNKTLAWSNLSFAWIEAA